MNNNNNNNKLIDITYRKEKLQVTNRNGIFMSMQGYARIREYRSLQVNSWVHLDKEFNNMMRI